MSLGVSAWQVAPSFPPRSDCYSHHYLVSPDPLFIIRPTLLVVIHIFSEEGRLPVLSCCTRFPRFPRFPLLIVSAVLCFIFAFSGLERDTFMVLRDQPGSGDAEVKGS
jgi:hypothetical protein